MTKTRRPVRGATRETGRDFEELAARSSLSQKTTPTAYPQDIHPGCRVAPANDDGSPWYGNVPGVAAQSNRSTRTEYGRSIALPENLRRPLYNIALKEREELRRSFAENDRETRKVPALQISPLRPSFGYKPLAPRFSGETRRSLKKFGFAFPADLLRAWLPYGRWRCGEGRFILFNRQYLALWEVLPNETVRMANPFEWVKDIVEERYYYDAVNPPWLDVSTVGRCAEILYVHGTGDLLDKLLVYVLQELGAWPVE